MKLTDLRVGNTVYWLNGAGEWELNNIDSDDIRTAVKSENLFKERYKPVLLTDPVLDKVKIEIGTKVGILFDGKYNLDIKNDVTRMSLAVYTTIETGDHGFVAELHGEHGFVVLKEIQYLHQLQNLAYVLTGNELEIDLSL